MQLQKKRKHSNMQEKIIWDDILRLNKKNIQKCENEIIKEYKEDNKIPNQE